MRLILKKINFYSLYNYLGLFFKRTVNSKKTRFSGWDMMTASQPPWESYDHNNSKIFEGDIDFLEIQSSLENSILSGAFKLTQFQVRRFEKSRELMWRHFIVVKSLNLVIQNNQNVGINLVECGVCDGLSAYFVLRNLTNKKLPFLIYLYDSWDVMKPDYLTESENSRSGKYDYLNIKNTKYNLLSFEKYIKWNQGYIPEVFNYGNNPETVDWLHVDLNSALPTKESLKFFSNKLSSGSVILFDDYSWPGHEDARYEIDTWVAEQNGYLLPFPTGQAIFIKT